MMPLKDGKRRLEGEHAIVGLALTGDLAALDRHLAQVGQLRQAQILGDDRGHRSADAVGGLVTGDDQLGALDGAQRAGQRPPRLHDVGAVHAVVEQVHRFVGAHRQGLAVGIGRTLGTGCEHGHSAFGAVGGFLLLDQKRLFDGALVDLVEHGVGGRTVESEIAVGQLAL
jgi:hypothetical protein